MRYLLDDWPLLGKDSLALGLYPPAYSSFNQFFRVLLQGHFETRRAYFPSGHVSSPH
jgi:hypothetical protein